MKKLWFIMFMGFVGVPAVSRSNDDAENRSGSQNGNEEMMMVVGEQRMLDAMDIESFSESTRGVIEVKVPRDGRKMIVTAIRPGTTSLLLIHKNGRQHTLVITAFAMLPETVEKELKELLKDKPSLSLRRVGPRVFIEGKATSKEALERIQQTANVYRGQVQSLVEVDPNAVIPRTNIRLDLAFVEIRKNDHDKLGISWPATYGASGTLEGTLDLMSGSLTAAYQVVDQAVPALEAAAQYGWAKIRKRASVITTSGHRAHYLAGGEVNIAIAGSQAAELRSIPYGAALTVTPRLSEDERIIDLEVSAEVSDLTESNSDVPGRTVSKVETLVHLGLGQSIMLSGLDAESMSTAKEGLPYLSKIPILGQLFGTRSHRESQTEGIIIITPTVLDQVDPAGKQALKRALTRFEAFDGDFEDLNEIEE